MTLEEAKNVKVGDKISVIYKGRQLNAEVVNVITNRGLIYFDLECDDNGKALFLHREPRSSCCTLSAEELYEDHMSRFKKFHERKKKWYIIEHHAEGGSADLALLTPELAEAMAKVLNSTEDTNRFYDEGYSGYTEIRMDLGGFKTKKEAIDKWRAGKPFIEDDDILIDIEEEEE